MMGRCLHCNYIKIRAFQFNTIVVSYEQKCEELQGHLSNK